MMEGPVIFEIMRKKLVWFKSISWVNLKTAKGSFNLIYQKGCLAQDFFRAKFCVGRKLCRFISDGASNFVLTISDFLRVLIEFNSSVRFDSEQIIKA